MTPGVLASLQTLSRGFSTVKTRWRLWWSRGRCLTCWGARAETPDGLCAWCAALVADTLDRLRTRRSELEHLDRED